MKPSERAKIARMAAKMREPSPLVPAAAIQHDEYSAAMRHALTQIAAVARPGSYIFRLAHAGLAGRRLEFGDGDQQSAGV